MVQLYTALAYPRLAGVVRHDLPKVVNDKRKFNAFKKFGQFNEEKAREILKPGSDPVLCVSQLPPGVFGQYRAGDEIHINQVIVQQHENIINSWINASAFKVGKQDHWLALVQRATLIVESIILHELVHWGDLKADGLDSDPEAIRLGWKDIGHMFVHHAYGAQFAIEMDRIEQRRVKIPKMDIEGWMGWGVIEYEGETYAIPYDPWYGHGAGSGPPLPPGSI
ncbi:MAG: hypothetical protein H6975_04455 [Gammaproteobacteria bacterium]|nr:hypothetical protein [Gammaproteobacteria bacterium]